jgi:hypothetical protein
MANLYSWPWVEAQVAQTIEIWLRCAAQPTSTGPQYAPHEQNKREHAYDQGLLAVEREAKRVPRTKAERLGTQDRIIAAFARFSASALDLKEEATQLLTEDFLPIGTALARWARRFDPNLSMADIIQACRNAWTACGLQPLLGERIRITPSIIGYSLLYPYSDNYLDSADVSTEEKIRFSERFREQLRGASLPILDSRESALWAMIQLIEGQYPRTHYPQVFDCLLAIHQAQEQSIAQVKNSASCDDAELLRVSCAKGGSSVLADACLARGWLTEEESRFAFEWGVLLQLGDDLQDVREDILRGSVTLFSRAAAQGRPLDNLVVQLLNFAECVGNRMDNLAHGTPTLRNLLKMSWRSLIIGAVANSHEFFSLSFLEQAERSSPFRFEFLRARRERLTSREGLYATLFEAFLEAPENGTSELPLPERSALAFGVAGI